MTVSPDSENRRPAAVLLLVYPRAGRYYTVFTKRTDRVGTHKGEVSLPGGGWEPGDRSLVDTALRETWEEVGVEPASVSVLAELEPVQTRGSNYLITPYVGLTGTTPVWVAHDREVAAVIELPVSEIDHPDVIRVEPMLIRGETRLVTYFVYDGHTIWGATAQILRVFHQRLRDDTLLLPDGRPLRELVLPAIAK